MMTGKNEKLKKLKDEIKEKADGNGQAGEALLKLVNVLWDTNEEKLPELSRLERREVFPMSIQMMKEQALVEGRKEPLSKIWRTAYLRLKRSVDMRAFMIGAGLAHEQAQAETEKGEEEEW